MLSKKRRSPEERAHASHDSTRCCLISTAKRVFARCGFEGASVRTLAEEARANVSAISYHFAGKEGLYRAVIEPIAAKMNELAAQTLKAPTSATDFRVRLEIFIERFLALHAEEPEIVQILLRDFPSGNDVANDVFQRSFLPLGEAMRRYFESARREGILRPNADPEIASAILFGTISSLSRFEGTRVKSGLTPFLDQNNVSKTVNAIVANFCDGALPEIRR